MFWRCDTWLYIGKMPNILFCDIFIKICCVNIYFDFMCIVNSSLRTNISEFRPISIMHQGFYMLRCTVCHTDTWAEHIWFWKNEILTHKLHYCIKEKTHPRKINTFNFVIILVHMDAMMFLYNLMHLEPHSTAICSWNNLLSAW